MTNKQIITKQEELNNIISKAMKTDAVGLDTEFVWERTYYPNLGLIQISLNDEECYAIDPLNVEDLSPLGSLLADPNITKILHDAPQDLTILSKACGNVTPRNIFDTRVAAGFAGSSATISLANLISEQLHTEIDKGATRTDWLKRPLSSEQLSYSLNDVRYLRALRVLLLKKTITPTVKFWLHEELDQLDSPESYAPIKDEKRYTKIKGINKLKNKEITLIKNICIWREETARIHNKPRGHIIKDEIILEICEKIPRQLDNLQETSISSKAFSKYGEEIIKITNSISTEATSNDIHKASQLTAKEKEKLKKLKEFIVLKCKILDIDPSLIGNTRELKKLIKSTKDNSLAPKRQNNGWRKEFLTEFIQNEQRQ
ncbi:MAG: HRDC domain-containing protein [Desulfotalea sp.]